MFKLLVLHHSLIVCFCYVLLLIFKVVLDKSNNISACITRVSIDQEHMFRARDLNARLVLPVIDANLKMFYDNCWQEKLQAEFAVRGETHGGNKLRTYRTFKNTYSTEPYVRIIAQKKF